MDGRELRERRRAQGLTLRQVARASGTSESTVSAYERDVRRPGAGMARRLVAMIDVGASSPIHVHGLLTVPAVAAALRRGVRERWSTADLLRLVREMRSNSKFAIIDADRAAFFAEPSTTGDPRWDAMLAANAEDLALRGGFPAPAWSAGHPLSRFWFVGSSPSLHAYAFARSPISMQVRGIMVDPADLEAV